MKNFMQALWWFLVGFWVDLERCFVFPIDPGTFNGAMPIGMFIFVFLLIGGLCFFLLTHILIRRLWPDKESV